MTFMKIIDITKELFSSKPFPGDPAPSFELEKTIAKDGYNLTVFSACAHNGTHVDAPCHFLENSSTVSDIMLNKCMGKCVVVDNIGMAMEQIEYGVRRIILKGINLSPSQAERLSMHVDLLGMDSESFGSGTAPGAVHRILLSREVVLLENLDLECVVPGEYTLIALPLKMKGSDGSPVRAILIDET